MKKTEETIKLRMRRDRDALLKLEARRWKTEHKKYVGRWFKYRNSYGSGEAWWLYRFIVRMAPGQFDTHFVVFQFQKCSLGKVSIETERYGMMYEPGDIGISEQEAQAAWVEMLHSTSLPKGFRWEP